MHSAITLRNGSGGRTRPATGGCLNGGRRDLSIRVCDTISRTVNRAGYRGAPQDVTHLARTLFATLRGPWRQMQGPEGGVRDLEQLADRLAAYGQANLPRFRRRASQLDQE